MSQAESSDARMTVLAAISPTRPVPPRNAFRILIMLIMMVLFGITWLRSE